MVMKKYLFICLCGLFLSAQCSKKKIETTAMTPPSTTTVNHSTNMVSPSPTIPTPPPNDNTPQVAETLSPPPATATKTIASNANTNGVMQYYVPVLGRMPDPKLTQCYRTLALEIGVEWIQFYGKILPQHIESNKTTDTVLRQRQGDNWQKDLEEKVKKCRNQP